MERRKYCVYNQTSESFLSFGVTVADGILARLKEIIGKRTASLDEGLWVARPKVIHSFGVFSARDLVYLDEEYRVLQAVEAFPSFHLARPCADAASVLELPVHTIYSSNTQPGNQLVVCVAEEMEFRLRSSANAQLRQAASNGPQLAEEGAKARDRRRAAREQWPRLVAYDWTGACIAVSAIRDISSTGMYLLTKQRWPIGTLVMMTLQRTDDVEETFEPAITVQTRVVRWGADGVGLLFVQPVAQESTLLAAVGR
jgi:uncharacterized membrane protein (UPF0127 family)